MWARINCAAQNPLRNVKATLVADGLNFICPICQHRNTLINIGTDHLYVVQPEIDWDEFKARKSSER